MNWPRLGLIAWTSAVLLSGSVATTAFAIDVPSALDREVLIKNTLVTFNDANMTGNYVILHAKASKPLRDQVPADKMKDAFKAFSEKHVDISGAVAKPIVEGEAARIDNDGILYLTGSIAITGSFKVNYSLKYLQSDGEWKLLGINVKT